MPNIPHIRFGQAVHKPSIRRGHKTSASEEITNKALDAKHKRERRLRQERRFKKIKVSFDQRRRSNRRKQSTAEDIEKPDNNSIGSHINTQA
jgi:hypothetical protein